MNILSFIGSLGRAAGDYRQVSASDPLPVTSVPAAATVAATVTEGSCIPAATNTPKPLTAVQTLVATVTLYARRGARTDNTGTVWWGFTAGDDTQQKPLVVGDSTVITAPPGKLIDLGTIYIDAVTLNDGVQFVAML